MSPVWFHVAAIAAVAVWATSFICTKVLLQNGFNPVEIFLFRCAIAYFLLLAVSKGEISTVRGGGYRHELLFVLCGVCGGSVYFVTENTALLYTSTSNVSLITSTPPLLTALLVGFMYKDERPNVGLVTGSIVAFIGVVCVIFNGSSGGHGEDTGTEVIGSSMLGDGLAMMSAVCWSFYGLLLRKLNAFYSAIFITRKTFFYGFITALPFLLLEKSNLTMETFTIPSVWFNMLFLGIVCSSLAFLIWSWVTAGIGAVKTNNYLYFQPIITLIIAAIVLSEGISVAGVAGCVITIGGVWLGENLSRRTESRR